MKSQRILKTSFGAAAVALANGLAMPILAAEAETGTSLSKAESVEVNTPKEKVITHKIPPLLDSARSEKTFALSPADLKFGDHQVRIMVASRPQMNNYVLPGDPIWNWCARQYAGECTGSRYLWDGNAQPMGFPAWHTAPEQSKSGTISLDRILANGEQYWACAIYELLNIRNDPAFHSIEEKTAKGEVSPEEHLKFHAKLEYEAARKLADFYSTYWTPQITAKKLATNSQFWGAALPPFEEWFKAIPKESAYFQYSDAGISFCTIGIQIDPEGKITKVFEHSPAEEKHLCVNDQMLAVGGQKLDHMSIQRFAHLVDGPYGESVSLTIKRATDGTEANVVLVRAPVPVN